jgi:hypothetical protein
MSNSMSNTDPIVRTPISNRKKAEVAASGKCHNRPDRPAVGCIGYDCPMWRLNGGNFDEAGFEIDHIVEVKHGGTNEIHNLQALCPSCHAVKTKRCSKQKWDFTSEEIESGRSHMAVDGGNRGGPNKRKSRD